MDELRLGTRLGPVRIAIRRAWKPRKFEYELTSSQVVVRDWGVESIEWTPPARPFFEKQWECPQGDSNP